MQNNDIPRILLPDWFPRIFLSKQWYIRSTGRDENGRTPFIMYLISGREVSVFTGQNLDSKEDYESFQKMSQNMAEFARKSRYKQAMSELDAKKLSIG